MSSVVIKDGHGPEKPIGRKDSLGQEGPSQREIFHLGFEA